MDLSREKLIFETSAVIAGFLAASVCQANTERSMPVADHTGLIPTLNHYGWMTPQHSPMSRRFVEFSQSLNEGHVLDIGTSYGFVPQDLLRKTFTLRVTANDLDINHLEILKSSVPACCQSRLEMAVGHFPNDLSFPDHSFDAILASRVFHFLTGEELEEGVKKLYAWLKPGGRVFVLANSPYRGNFQTYIPQYEKRKLHEKYPGIIRDYSQVPQTIAPQLPKFVHLLDLDVIQALFLEASFEIEFAEYLHLDTLYPPVRLDNREDVGVIAVKPLN